MKIILSVAVAAAALTLAAPAFAANEYDITASTSPTKSGTKSKPAPVGLKLGFSVKDTEGGRPLSMEKLAIGLEGIVANTNSFAKCSATKIEQEQGDKNCPKGSLIGDRLRAQHRGRPRRPQGRSIKCYLSLRLHNSGNNKLALLVTGDPQPAGDKNCRSRCRRPSRSASSSLEGRLDEPLDPREPQAPGQDAHQLGGRDEPRRQEDDQEVGRPQLGVLETVGACASGKRAVTMTFNNEGNNVARQSTRARCS